MLKKILIVVGVLACLLVGGFGYVMYNTSQTPDMSKVQAMSQKAAPNLQLTTFSEKKPVALSELIGKGKPVYLNFWATWCPPCVREMPYMNELYPKYKDKMDFVIASVDEKETDVVTFQKKNNYQFPIYYAKNSEVASAYQLQGIPTSVLIDGQGNIITVHVGSMSKEDMESFFNKAF